MEIEFRPVTADDVAAFIEWRYEPPYGAYAVDIPIAEAHEYFTGPEVRCHAMLRDGTLIGFCTFGMDGQVPGGDYSEDALDIGAGMEPSTTGKGNGTDYVAAIVGFALRTFAPERLRVTIAAGNGRAITVWTRNGFEETSRFDAPRVILDSTEFVILERAA